MRWLKWIFSRLEIKSFKIKNFNAPRFLNPKSSQIWSQEMQGIIMWTRTISRTNREGVSNGTWGVCFVIGCWKSVMSSQCQEKPATSLLDMWTYFSLENFALLTDFNYLVLHACFLLAKWKRLCAHESGILHTPQITGLPKGRSSRWNLWYQECYSFAYKPQQ